MNNKPNNAGNTAYVALPLHDDTMTSLYTATAIGLGGVAPGGVPGLFPVDLTALCNAEETSLNESENEYRINVGSSAIPSSFDTAVRFTERLTSNNPGVAQTELIGLMCVFALQPLYGYRLEAKSIALNNDEAAPIVKSLYGQLLRNGEKESTLRYFCIDGKPFAIWYPDCGLCAIKDRKKLAEALVPFPLFNRRGNNGNGEFEAITPQTIHVDIIRTWCEKLTAARQVNLPGTVTNALVTLGRALENVTRIDACRWADVLETADNCPAEIMAMAHVPLVQNFVAPLPSGMFSDKLLLLKANTGDNQTIWQGIGQGVYPHTPSSKQEGRKVFIIPPLSPEFAEYLATSPNVSLIGECSFEEGAESDNFVVVRQNLKIDNRIVTLRHQYDTGHICTSYDNGTGVKIVASVDNINIGIDHNVNIGINPQTDARDTEVKLPRRYVVWECNDNLALSFVPAPNNPNDHNEVEAKHAGNIINYVSYYGTSVLPSFAVVKSADGRTTLGCIPLPEARCVSNNHGDDSSAIYLDVGTTNTICAVRYGEGDEVVCVDLCAGTMRCPQNSTRSAEFAARSFLSDAQGNDTTLRAMRTTVMVGDLNRGVKNTELYASHIVNIGDRGIRQLFNAESGTSLMQKGIYDNIKWSGSRAQQRGYTATVSEILSAAATMIALNGYNLANTTIYVSYPTSMSEQQILNIREWIEQALIELGIEDTKLSLDFSEGQSAATYALDGKVDLEVPCIGADIGGGSVDMFLISQEMDASTGVLHTHDSIADVAGRAILIDTLLKFFKAGRGDRLSPIFSVDPKEQSIIEKEIDNIISLENDRDAMCMVEQFVATHEIASGVTGEPLRELQKLRRNITLKLFALLNYILVFARESSDTRGLNIREGLSIFLCGNGSKIFDWIGRLEEDKFDRFVRAVIGGTDDGFKFSRVSSREPKQEVVRGLDLIAQSGRAVHAAEYSEPEAAKGAETDYRSMWRTAGALSHDGQFDDNMAINSFIMHIQPVLVGVSGVDGQREANEFITRFKRWYRDRNTQNQTDFKNVVTRDFKEKSENEKVAGFVLKIMLAFADFQ